MQSASNARNKVERANAHLLVNLGYIVSELVLSGHDGLLCVESGLIVVKKKRERTSEHDEGKFELRVLRVR